MVMNLPVPKGQGVFLPPERLLVSEEGLHGPFFFVTALQSIYFDK
jgi:hypothetical protein